MQWYIFSQTTIQPISLLEIDTLDGEDRVGSKEKLRLEVPKLA